MTDDLQLPSLTIKEKGLDATFTLHVPGAWRARQPSPMIAANHIAFFILAQLFKRAQTVAEEADGDLKVTVA